MDWPQENARIDEKDLRKVFKYEPKPTTVVRFLAGDNVPVMNCLETDEDWDEWMSSFFPKGYSSSGIVLIVARRPSHADNPCQGKLLMRTSGGLEISNIARLLRNNSNTDVPAGDVDESWKQGEPRIDESSSTGRRSTRVLPFSKSTFRAISERFCLHGSIAQVVNRHDVPIFSRALLNMVLPGGITHPAYVYNCRSTNAWDMDLALTATHFPELNLTLGLFFGCPKSAELEIIRRLSLCKPEALHPLILPGIFIEFERNRHLNIVEAVMDDVEKTIVGIEFEAEDVDADQKNRAKRVQWLDTTYLRNSLLTWTTQLVKMVEHTEELEKTMLTQDMEYLKDEDNVDANREQVRRMGAKIKDRLRVVINEYEDKVRECTMRLDGMTMATQWAQGETNVEIALAAGRDSRHMRSIAIVTMVFLPGTFLAGVFSMSFFSWNEETVVSSYFWIYVLVTTVTTAFTLGSWYYFVVWRKTPRKMSLDEEAILMSSF
ncbi:hypothetical protein BX600DRAFT_472188 [Xylariales sp. PMI_506]|nr:hypothetical protein BX600DRAFT_472188 [Xylariales sp. PMI_506]